MIITVRIVNDVGDASLVVRFPVDALALTVVAEARQEIARERGVEWARGAISFCGREFFKAVEHERPEREVQQSAIDIALAIWVYNSVWTGLCAESFVHSDIDLTVTSAGVVRCDRSSDIEQAVVQLH